MTPTHPRLFGRPTVLAPTGTRSAELDREATETSGVPGPVLMENAGRTAALLLRRLIPDAPVAVVAGAGNNGGDGMVLARTLRAWGVPVTLHTVGRNPLGDPLLHGWDLSASPLPDDEEEARRILAGARVVVDALLGTGISGSPRPPHARAIRAMNGGEAPIFALDLPSGVLADTGEVPDAAVEAAVTVAFGSPKVGALLFPGRRYAGRLLAVEIGFPPWDPEVVGSRLITPGWFSRHRPRRALVTHKNAEGRLLILAGGPPMAGAALLAARGALAAGVGYLRVASDAANRELFQGAIPEAVFVDSRDPHALREAVEASDALAAGPGMGTEGGAAEVLARLLEEGAPPRILLDADALTPHPGEMARLEEGEEGVDEGGGVLASSPPLFRRALAGATRYRSSLLLKGNPSVVAGFGESGEPLPILVSTTGSSALARAGMGDVLTGVAGAFLARGVDSATAGGLALHLTGRGAQRGGGDESLTPSQVVAALEGALREGEDGHSDLADLPFLLLDLEPPR